MREFKSGATRDADTTKPDPEGCYHPLVLKTVADYMAKHSYLPDGTRRAADNWMAGMPRAVWRKSLERHWLDVKLHDRGHGGEAREPMIDALCAVIFNAQGRLLEELLDRDLEEDAPKRKRPSKTQETEDMTRAMKAWAQQIDEDFMRLLKPKKYNIEKEFERRQKKAKKRTINIDQAARAYTRKLAAEKRKREKL